MYQALIIFAAMSFGAVLWFLFASILHAGADDTQ